MSDRLTYDKLNFMLREIASVGSGFVQLPQKEAEAAFSELLDRRAADTKPAPIEQGTLRDVLAGRAMASLLACFGWPCDTDEMARLAYVIADAMLAQRAQEPEKP